MKSSAQKTALILAVIAALVMACGVTRGEQAGLHRVRMMVPNSPGGGYDLTARTAVKIMEDDNLTGRVEVFNVIGAGGTVAMARLMNEKGNGDLMMMMGLGVVGATYTNGSPARASDATALAKMVEEQEGILVPADSPFKTVQDLDRVGSFAEIAKELRLLSVYDVKSNIFSARMSLTVSETTKSGTVVLQRDEATGNSTVQYFRFL